MDTQSDHQMLDWNRLIDRWGDEDLIREITPIFLADSRERLETLREAVKTGDAAVIAGSAHAIKGSGRNFEARRLSEIAGRMECAGRENDLTEATLLFEQLATELDKMMTFLSKPDWIEIAKCVQSEISL